ncbi:hypothetical protein Asp14428_29650 [Actinoplanes sp. NBRC 14428]|uniref:Uncharacterized protein n=1 Tax=Pseudosporangium ferrugineum TaxID=439699 RepID=A0A2T0RS31_9ACTN|nr:hypothetical protein [Pseudosporangium ferrugineum]PRY23927.1 hypothetical protein CLV70_11459 [Pseudosporangium ferrugineum]BCJ51490.1 hypothetical protein Asp14428_29650 [Actinoplanes sp. NBRC 14428]
MKLFRRNPKLPAGRRPPLESEERVLAWAATGDEGVLVATNRGLWLPDGRRLGWHEIHRAAWSGRELRITPAEQAQQRDGYTVLVDAPVIGFLVLEPGELPDHVRTRVSRSVAYTSHHPLPPNGGVRVVGRRVSGVDGLTWSVRYDAKTAVDAEPVVEVTDQLVAAAQEASAPPA